MGLIQEVQELKKANKEQQEIAERELSKKELQEQKKIHQKNLLLELEKYFYIYFKKEKRTEQDIIKLYKLENREKIIFEIAKDNAFDSTFLNQNYEKCLEKISKIFFNNEKATKISQKNFIKEYITEEFEKVPFENDDINGFKAHCDLIYKNELDKKKSEIIYNIDDIIKETETDFLDYEEFEKQVELIYKKFMKKSKARQDMNFPQDILSHNEECNRRMAKAMQENKILLDRYGEKKKEKTSNLFILLLNILFKK